MSGSVSDTEDLISADSSFSSTGTFERKSVILFSISSEG